jgi:DNA-binding MarR family transcriptional regulator
MQEDRRLDTIIVVCQLLCALEYPTVTKGLAASDVSRAWGAFMRHAERQVETMTAALKREGLSPVMAGFLDEIAKHPPAPMSRLVGHLGIDAAWVTDVIDKLEARGDVVRRSSPGDRRVKIVELTDAGRRTHRMIEELMSRPPRALVESSVADQRAFERIARRLIATEETVRGAAAATTNKPSKRSSRTNV